MAFIQSLLKFKTIGIIHVISGSGKLLVGVILVYINLNIYGAILATLAFSIINFLTSIIPIKNVIKNRSGNVNISINEFGKYAIPTIVSIFALSSFISSDVLLVKHFFNSTEAGLYGGLALVGRVIFYFTGPIALAMFPLIVKRHSMGVKYTGLLYISVALVLIPSTAITIFYFLFPNLTITLFLGGDAYLTISRYLGLYGIFIMIFSINNIFVNFYLSIKKTFVSYLVSATAILQIVLIYIFHDNFYQIIFVSIITSVLLLICLLLYYLLINRSYVVKR
jgi:O-antigen/teichoic acid export membrane protein